MDITASKDFTTFMLRGKVKEAEALAREQLLAAPNDADAHAALAHAFMAEHKLGDALAQASEAIRLSNDDVGFWFLRSRLHFALGRFKQAADDAQTVLSRSSTDYFANSAKLLRAASWIQDGHYQEGLDELSSVPDDVSVNAGGEVVASELRRVASQRLSSRPLSRGM